jgi:hypothetical protein
LPGVEVRVTFKERVSLDLYLPQSGHGVECQNGGPTVKTVSADGERLQTLEAGAPPISFGRGNFGNLIIVENQCLQLG